MTTITPSLILGDPQVAGPLAVYPVRATQTPRLDYRSLAAASQRGAFVKERDGGASVRELIVDNPTDLPLLVYEGEEVLGAQQNRTFDVSILVAARSRLQVPVSCVEQGRWDGTRAAESFAPAPQAADPGLRRVKRARANERAAVGAPARADQGEVWQTVAARLTEHGVASPSSAMNDVYESRRHDLDELVGAVHPIEDQIGALATISGRPVALDLVSRADVLADLLPRLAQGYALDALGAAEGPVDPATAHAFLASALHAPRAGLPTTGMGEAVRLVSPDVVGSGLEHEAELIALSAFLSDEPPTTYGPPAPVARPSRRRRAR